MKYGILNPCNGCADRYIGCHGKCERYREYREHVDGVHREMDRQRVVDSYCIGTYKKIAQYLRRKEEGRKKDRR